MPGPGPRGPRQTYRAPCSRFRDSRFLARDPQKTANSRAARGTRTRQPGTRSTTDGLLCGENRSAAGGTRARAARTAPAADRNPAHGPRSPALDPRVCQIEMQTSAAGGTRARAARNAPAADRNPAHGPRSSSSSPSSSPTTGHQLDRGPDFFALFCGFCPKSPKNRRNRSRNLERIFSKKSRIGGNPPVLPKKTWTGLRDPRPLPNEIRRQIGQGPRPIGSDRRSSIIGSAIRGARPRARATGCKGHVSDK